MKHEKKIKYLFPILLIVFVALVPLAVIQSKGLVPCGGEGENECNLCYLFLMLSNVMNYMVNMVGIIAVVFLVIGGGVKVISGGSEELNKKGDGIITNTIIGTVIVLVAWLLINTIFTIAGFTRENIGLTGNWFEFTCTVGGDTLEEPKTITVTPTSHNFGIVDVGSSSEQDFTVSIPPESGELKIEYRFGTNNPEDFEFSKAGTNLAPSNITTVTIPNSASSTEDKVTLKFIPKAPGKRDGNLRVSIRDKDGNEVATFDIPIKGGEVIVGGGEDLSGPGYLDVPFTSNCTPCVHATNWTGAECEAAIKVAASNNNIQAQFLRAIMEKESNANLNAVSPHNACGPMQMLPGTARKSCAQLKSPASVGWSAEHFNNLIGSEKGKINNYKKKDGSNFTILELISSAYSGGSGANDESRDCGPGKQCNDGPLAKFENSVPRWYCPYDHENGVCKLNSGFEETRKYVPRVQELYNQYNNTSCKK